MLEHFKTTVGAIGWTLEGIGVLVIVIGSVIAIGRFLRQCWIDDERGHAYHEFRVGLGRSILVGLEFLIAGDIIRTVVVDQTLEALGSLAIIIFLRIVLSFSLFLEIEGRWPWQPPADRPRA
ncbi:protein of unknown function DUF1622 [Thioalkalivibrio nitratireducens DSM 14787]|uniref:DUF1622 domain-containing protein n=1 Tax=Thioalkalivibrio nitratireducens (strain DSM 14787 / UNIQEM 213 / ALEN2) TaxID=1255043 RepID=L0DWL9_THIND|nr:DUF1622 domain-containing protein [Thioalkalivibrio nitratireducens]AGA32771.1 protein of unknown function DUF1622 [Thioalkalivibrio nitratireducens DSM 14787]